MSNWTCVYRVRFNRVALCVRCVSHSYSDCVYMQEHNRVMTVSNEDWFHVNRFI